MKKNGSLLQYLDPKSLKMIDGNRIMDVRHIHKLMKAISQRNMLDLCPILINKGRFIIDGQHRVAAAQALGIKSVPCVVAEGASLRDAQELNQKQKNWGPRDFAFSYAQLGDENYGRFRKFLDDTELRYTVALALIMGKLHSQLSLANFKAGQFTFTKAMEKEAYRRIEMLEEFKPYLVSYNSRSFVQAWIQCESHSAYDHKRMMKKTEEAGSIYKSGDHKLYVEQLEKIYNKGETDKIRFHRVGSASRG